MFAEMNRRTLAFRGGGLLSAAAANAANAIASAASSSATANGTPDPEEAWVRPEPEPVPGQGVEEEVELATVELEASELEAPSEAKEEEEQLLLGPAAAPVGPMFAERNRRTLAFRGGGGGGASGAAANNGCEAGAAWPRRPLNGRDEELELFLSGKELAQDGGSLSDSSDDDEDGEEEGSCSSGHRSGGDEAEAEAGDALPAFPLPSRPQSLLQKLHVSFQSSWLKEFPWIQYCQQTGLVSCAWCAAAAASSADSNGSGGHDELCKGTRSYRRALLLRHHLSAEHRLNEPVSAEQESEITSELINETDCDYNVRPNENSYCYQLLQELNEQRKKGILCDVNIVVSGRVFRAHKNILVAGSRYFKTLYCFTNKENRNQTTVTYLDVVAVQGFSVILDFLYSGNLVLTSQNAIEVMSVASYLQMTEVVQSCRNFIKDALNISIKSEAPEAVVVDYNRRSISRDQKVASFWATRNLTNLASSIKTENDGYCIDESQSENYQMNDWVQDSSPEMAENESQGEGKVFVWNDISSQGQSLQEPGKARRKNQAAKRFVYNIPPNNEETLDDCSTTQASIQYPEDLQFIKEEAGSSNDFKFGMFPGISSDFKFGLLPGTSNDFKYGLLPESWPKENWENGDSSLIMNKLKCPHCNYVAKYRRTLKRHLLIHTGVRSFSCDICGKLFTRREHVKRHSLVHKKDKKYKCMVCKKIFMLAASVGIRHGSRRYGVCVDCADKSQPGGQEGVDQVQDTDFPRDEEFEENEVGDADEELPDDVEEQNDQTRWDESGEVCVPLED
ncbi:zinc finger and BTB domain-containing protein 10 [Anolis carolinensis]|uniref:zinc finger and BTB domain-containing protein 10 n=1 Tax=Anolis carolinensis TaxID=28377 RepID=UPI00046252A8|nr:PREDICTED: zinc finger and BTB domain-containing protein 10 [Anolis carolinensis]|eukprot:XP_008106668.1 PREDICTED: zinc finger and BTB domain-containing protein 10 [Anolis carolinensis]